MVIVPGSKVAGFARDRHCLRTPCTPGRDADYFRTFGFSTARERRVAGCNRKLAREPQRTPSPSNKQKRVATFTSGARRKHHEPVHVPYWRLYVSWGSSGLVRDLRSKPNRGTNAQ
jgi:hypothetical protein